MQSMFPVWFVSLLLLTIFITLQLQHVVDQSNHCRKLIVPVSVGSKSSHYPHPSLYDYNITQSGADEGFRDMYFAPVLEAYRKVAEKSYAEMPQRRFRSGYIPKVVMYVNHMYVYIEWYYMHMKDINEGRCPLPCNITSDIKEVTSADAVLIHLLSVKSAEKLSEELGTRDQSQPWIMFEPETHFKGNVMFRNDYKLLNGVFNRTMHYRRDSDILMLHGFVVRRGRDASLLPPTWRRQPELHQINNTQKLAVAFISNCKDKSGRLEYIEALKKYAPIDVYGKCGELKCGHSLFTNEGYRIDLEPCMKYAGHHYLFFLAFENALCKDYVSEKLYNLLYYPMVPVVLGGADYSALLPPNSYINAQEYSPQQLAEKLQHLANHPKEYQTYLTWRHYYQPSTVGGSRVLCDLCVRLYDQDLYSHKVIDDFYDWYVKQSNCSANGKV
ncbi:3-galactosyl-N-acetylglucosaminide 4-alpha-L-fucosyltransferase FUT3-like isoform X2 [Homarus americanus]|uniref:3-galactosyl-N-acetylglucosaminide 4-alpha-L-fucosyltransferase FUT3-like isoform X2 n=1 Tax=Homarus americanus TaxID=6706 RepID=UPI001C45ED77|nr:3-galactosyl-N-acetylglucosaminide 4-alpha-L-fucosyltransferase FUT3-like isoform X2 [Homarus americanus]